MEFSRELLFFFSALGAFNGLVLGLYFLLFANPKHISSRFLGVLLLTLSIRIGKSVFFYFNPDLAEIYLQLGISACAFVGPSLYFYLKTKTQQVSNASGWALHYLIIFLIVLVIGVLYPWESNYLVWRYTFKAIYLQWLIYTILSGLLIKESLAKLLRRKQKLSNIEIWISSIFIGNLLIWIAFNLVNYTSYIVGALSFTFILYLVILFLFLSRKKETNLLKQQVKYSDKKIDDTTARALIEKIDTLMKEESLYQNADLKLPDLAKRLGVLPHLLSQLVNDNLGKNFSLFINEYRIEEAKRMLAENTHLKLEAIGYDCGFNSKSTFFAAFKKITGYTPAAFQSQQKAI